MSRLWQLALLVPALAACEDASTGLGDGGARDARPRPDVGPAADGGGAADAGPMADAGSSEDSGAGPLPLCGATHDFFLDVRGFNGGTFEGVLRQTPTGVIRLASEDGSVSITFTGPTPQVLFSANGFWGQLESGLEFTREARLTLWSLDIEGRPAGLAMYAWAGRRFGEGAVGRVRYHYVDGDCAPEELECGRLVARALIAEVDGEVQSVPFGARVERPGYQVFNGRSQNGYGEPGCRPPFDERYAGWIAVPAALGTCVAMARDDCIASPACVLWGSEQADPGYLCVPAAGMCEPHVDRDACNRTTGCVWDVGECYCPEGQECFCAGGPAPKCKDRCGSPGPCPEGRFCDFDRLEPPMCVAEPNPEGRCEWRPRSCAGVAEVQVCACGSQGAQSFRNDCEARTWQASGRTLGRCPP